MRIESVVVAKEFLSSVITIEYARLDVKLVAIEIDGIIVFTNDERNMDERLLHGISLRGSSDPSHALGHQAESRLNSDNAAMASSALSAGTKR